MKLRLHNIQQGKMKHAEGMLKYGGTDRRDELRKEIRQSLTDAASGAIAAKIRRRLKMLDISNAKFAEMLGTHSPVVSKWLSGKHNFELKTLVDIERALDITIIDRNVIPLPELRQMNIGASFDNVISCRQEVKVMVQYVLPGSSVREDESLNARRIFRSDVNLPVKDLKYV